MGLQPHFMGLLVTVVFLITTPHSTQAQDERKAVHESPYYLSGLSNIPFNFSGDSSEGSGAFRVLGASTDGLSLSFTHAEASCLALEGGRGLARVHSAQRRATLSAALKKSMETLGDTEHGSKADLHWVGGWRTSLTDQHCTASGHPSWPYFTVGAQGSDATDYNGCGTDPLRDWVWRKWIDEERMIEEPFKRNGGVETWWENSSVTGIGNVHEPSGWEGPYNLAQGDRYQNCTATRVYSRSNKKAQPAAVGRAWLNDEVCTETLHRWVCEMESASSGSALTATGAAAHGKVASSPFYILGISGTPYPADDYKSKSHEGSVYRVLGIPPAADADFEFERSSHVLTWPRAQQACLDMGGLALAAPDKPAVTKPAFSFLKQVTAQLKDAAVLAGSSPASESQPAFWMSAVYLRPAGQNTTKSTSVGWTWFPTVTRGVTGNLLLTNSSAEWPMATNETRWDRGYPKQGVFAQELGLPIQSCAAAVWPEGATGERWQNFACTSHAVRYFICRFPDASTGMPDTTSSTEGRARGGLLERLPYDREIMLMICAAALTLLLLLCCCAYIVSNRCGCRSSEGTVVVSSVDHMLAWNAQTKALSKDVNGGFSMDPMHRSGRYLLAGNDSLGGGKWGELPEISENEAMGGNGPEQIRAAGTIAHRPQVLREYAGGPVTCDSIDAATKCMRASSYWSVAESMETDAVGNSIQDTVVDVRPDSKGRAMQAHFERIGQIAIADPTSEPPQGAIDCEPTVLNVPASPAPASSPESIGIRIPAALRWSLSSRSNEPSPGCPSEDGQGRQRTGSKLLARLRSAARRVGHASDNAEHRHLKHPHTQHHMQKSLSPSPRASNTGTDQQAPASESTAVTTPSRHATPPQGLCSIGSHSNFSPPSSQREFVGEEKCRTADGNVVTTHVFRRPSPQVSPESSFAEEPRPSSLHTALPPQIIIPQTSPRVMGAAADESLSARSHSHVQDNCREPSPRQGRHSTNDRDGVVYACEQYPPTPEAQNDLEPGPREDSGGFVDILRGSYPPPPNLTTIAPSPTGSMARHSSVHTSASNQTLGSISVFTAEPSFGSLSLEGPRHRMGPALQRYNSNTMTSKKFFSGQAHSKPATRAAQNSLEFPRGDSTATSQSVSTPWHRGTNKDVVAGASVNTSSDLVPLSEAISPYKPARSDSPPALGPKHSRGDVGVPTPASSRYAPQFQSSPEPESSPKPPLSYLSSANIAPSPTHSHSLSAPKSPRSPAPRPGRPHTLDVSIDYQPQSIWSQVTSKQISEGLEGTGTFGARTQTTALQHFSGSTVSGISIPSTPCHAGSTHSGTNTALTSPEITTALLSSPNANNSSSNVLFSPHTDALGPKINLRASFGTNSNASSPSQWTLGSSEFGWQGNRNGAASIDNSNQDSLSAAVAACTCLSPQSRRSSSAAPVPVSSAAGYRALPPTSGTMPSTQRSSVTSLDSTAGMHRLPPLLEDLPDNGVAEEGSAALVDAWLTSLKVNNRAKEAIDSLTTSLDALSVDPAKGDFGTVLGLFGLLGPVERIIGGQGVVQFAKKLSIDPSAPSAPEPQVALKFYMDPELIRVETAVYGNPTLATFGALPKSAQLHLKTTDEMQTCAGAPLPPCLIMERGMSLKEWMTHSRMSTHSLASDCKTAIKALLHLSQCLVALHSSGFVHRDVKPGAVLWLPSEHRWALINFCRAARIGAGTPAPCSLAYAAPEVAANASCGTDGGVHAGSEMISASPASDAWSLGIVALELFSRARALDAHKAGVETVLNQLQGHDSLPWERENGLRCLGPLVPCVSRLLARDPSQRPAVADFVRDATTALENVST